jgi:DNA end-binding protein Ku
MSLRMIDHDGTPLARRYFCSKENRMLSRDDLVRGYEIERQKFIEIDEEELEALEPEKSREIDLRRFVPVEDVEPMFFQRAYFLIPEEGALKAYRLLAYSMEKLARAGVATVVMRGREYLVAIIAEGGVLRAETLRFADELRSPDDIGLPPLPKTKSSLQKQARDALQSLSVETLGKDQLKDTYTQKLRKLIDRKLAAGEDVVEGADEEEPEKAEVIDLMQVLKERLEASSSRASENEEDDTAIDELTKKELYEKAKKLKIPGRSKMSRQALVKAVQKRES